CINHIFNFAIQEIVTQVERKKIQYNQMTFDDVITKLYLALNHTNPNKAKQKLQQDLIRGLRWKYQAVFIDEFQDTDAMQYQIFRKAFGSDTIVFFIGDPKQSIYAWRKADIETYFEARRHVDKEYTMTTNFRSSKNLVDALNHFFLPTKDFDTFYYKSNSEKEDAAISYFPVTTPENSTKGELLYNGNPIVPVTFSYHQKNEFILEEAVKQISDLLNNPAYSIKGNAIKPSDIGVLVRTRKEAQGMKAALSRIGIPAVTVTDARILQSPEAQELVYVLDAIISHTRAKVNRALTTSFINWTPEEILSLDEDLVIERFRNYLLKWQKNGIYSALSDFIHGFNVREHLIGQHTENGERIITNLYHLMEVLYRTENRQHFGPEELLDWLRANLSKPDSNDDEMVQRIESDEESVRIVTIHSSKGLEYNIVIAPYLDFVIRSAAQEKSKIISIRNPEGHYISIPRDQAGEDIEMLYKVQSEQENRRLLYVALTRAVYKCYIYRSNYYKGSTLATFIDALNLSQTQGLIEEVQPLEMDEIKGYTSEEKLEQFELTAPNFHLSHRNWTRTSYSRLAAQTEYIPRDHYETKTNDYDEFVFRELTKGSKTGTFIHDIFENIDFSNSENRKYAIARSIERFVPDKKDSYTSKIEMFLDEVLQTKINTGTDIFSLSEISNNELLHEMEFDFPLDLFPIKSLEQLISEGIAIKNAEEYPPEIEGIMTGFVDLFFRYNGKYYVLDWKTNYLGPRLKDYSFEAVAEAMRDHNYHLQYLIYTHAVNRYLSHRLGSDYDYNRDFGGVLYLFVRGMRKDTNTGIFFTKPGLEQLELMNSFFGEATFM
ncbi:MAG TPA: 3'-5' exonuclease, partial [Flavobacteriaceae bacterium]|nr:3'-5' exonuclease [Flavobacteriaceae bacterium]